MIVVDAPVASGPKVPPCRKVHGAPPELDDRSICQSTDDPVGIGQPVLVTVKVSRLTRAHEPVIFRTIGGYGVAVGVKVCVLVGVRLGVRVLVAVGVLLGVTVFVGVKVGVCVLVLVGVGVLVRVGVSLGVNDAPDEPASDTLMTLAVRYDSFTARR